MIDIDELGCLFGLVFEQSNNKQFFSIEIQAIWVDGQHQKYIVYMG